MGIRIADLIRKGFWTALDWIYPPVCAVCGEPGFHVCTVCLGKAHIINHRGCSTCGKPGIAKKDQCSDCLSEPPAYTAMLNLAEYDGVIRECIHALKYQNNQGLGAYFSVMLADLVRSEGWHVDLVIPVPLSKQRIRERGYNQSAKLARPLATRLNTRYNTFGLLRTRHTNSQVGLSAADRQLNVSGAFKAVPEIVAGKNVLLVDDVTTTGSTLEACAEALKEAGAHHVYCLTLARDSRRSVVSNHNHIKV